MRALCTHVALANIDGRIEVRSTFISPFGTTAWQCQECYHVTHDTTWIKENTNYWASHPDEWLKRAKQIEKLAKKCL